MNFLNTNCYFNVLRKFINKDNNNMNYKDTSKETLNKHIDHIIDICNSIPTDKITILTGGNALGKSLIRKQLTFYISNKKDIPANEAVISVSMQTRTESRPEYSALSGMTHDLPWCSTSDSTINLLNSMLSHAKNKFIVIDELEIGMSREVQAGVCHMLNEKFPDILKNNYGILVITHSEDVVKNLKHDNFINIEGMSEEQWLTRDIIPVDPSDLNTWAIALFKAVRDREKK